MFGVPLANCEMSALGQKQTSHRAVELVRLVPIADIKGAALLYSRSTPYRTI
jgi:hypothetical protein